MDERRKDYPQLVRLVDDLKKSVDRVIGLAFGEKGDGFLAQLINLEEFRQGFNKWIFGLAICGIGLFVNIAGSLILYGKITESVVDNKNRLERLEQNLYNIKIGHPIRSVPKGEDD